jgi:winged helix DNA-binding protein
VLPDRLAAQLLTGPAARDPVEVAERLLAIQAQDLRGALLAVRARSTGLTRTDVEDACTHDRSLVVTWLNRGTLHLVRAADYTWLHQLTAPRTHVANARRLQQEGVDQRAAARGVEVVVDALGHEGALTREQLRARLDAAGVRTAGQALVHLLLRASLEGHVLRGPFVGGAQAYVLTREWLGPVEALPREEALARLARRYLAGHGPADDRDLAKWAGLPLGDARAALRAIAAELVEQPGGCVTLRGRRPRATRPAPRLLGQFDPLLHGWRSRTEVLGTHEGVVTVNGIFRAIALVDGQAAGTWRIEPSAVELDPFHPLPAPVVRALERDAADVLRYLGLPARPPKMGAPQTTRSKTAGRRRP